MLTLGHLGIPFSPVSAFGLFILRELIREDAHVALKAAVLIFLIYCLRSLHLVLIADYLAVRIVHI